MARSTFFSSFFSGAAVLNGRLYISGQIGVDVRTNRLVEGGFSAEIHQAMHNIGAVLTKFHLNYSDLLEATIYLKDMRFRSAVDAVWATYFSGPFPQQVCLPVSDLPNGALLEINVVAAERSPAKKLVKNFLRDVRSGLYPDKAADYLADTVLAHQINSEKPITVQRTPANYAAHVREFLRFFGRFELTVTELLGDGDRVYARWIQKGTHQADMEPYKATGLPLVEYTSAVYRVENGKIVEYWLQTDRAGMEEQLKNNSRLALGEGQK